MYITYLALPITSEGEENNQIPYLNFMVMRKIDKISTTVSRKPTFSGQYVPFIMIAAKYT